MVIQLQTSFIPRKGPTALPSAPRIGGHGVNLFGIIALLLFFGSIALATLAFFYKSHLIRSITDLDASLALAKKSFEPEFIAEAARLNARIEVARGLLNTHRALSPLFDILEKKTLEQVRFQDFDFSASGGQEITIKMKGEAKSFNAVALQSDVFGAERSFTDPVFSNFNLDERGNVVFDFKTVIDEKLLLYRETLLDSSSSESPETADETPGSDVFEESVDE